MKGLKQIFTFTLKQQLNIKSVKILTVVMALLLFFGPFLGVVISSTRGSGSQAGTDAGTDIVPRQEDGPAVPSKDLYSADDFIIDSVFFQIKARLLIRPWIYEFVLLVLVDGLVVFFHISQKSGIWHSRKF